ncbi:MAG: TIGR00266 family protein [Spirochaetota bacterium]
MNYDITGRPDFSCLKIELQDGETVMAESGAMVAMSPGIQLQTSARGGIFRSLKRSVLGGESFFINTFTASGGNGQVYFSPPTSGDMCSLEIENRGYILSTGAYVCSTPGIELDSKWGGAKAFFGGEGLFFLKVTGKGMLFFSSFGAIHEIDVQGEYIVDTGHIVAFEESLNYNIEKVGGLKSLFLSGEGLVCRFQGTGKIYLQTRNHNSFAAWANQFRRVKKSSNN